MEQYEIYESKLNNLSLEELEIQPDRRMDVLIRYQAESARLSYKLSDSFLEKLAYQTMLELVINGYKPEIKRCINYNDGSYKAKRTINNERFHIASSTDLNNVKMWYYNWCKARNLDL